MLIKSIDHMLIKSVPNSQMEEMWDFSGHIEYRLAMKPSLFETIIY